MEDWHTSEIESWLKRDGADVKQCETEHRGTMSMNGRTIGMIEKAKRLGGGHQETRLTQRMTA